MAGALLTQVLLDLEALGSIKFGEFKLKSGILSPVYFDLRLMVSKASLMQNIADLLSKVQPSAVTDCDLLCGVPYTALPLATLMSVAEEKPMLIRRKEAKSYGTGQILEGNFKAGQRCVIVEDVITSGASVLETACLLRSHGLVVDTALVFLNRNQGGMENLAKHGIVAHCVTNIEDLVNCLRQADRISAELSQKVISFTLNVKTSLNDSPDISKLSFDKRLGMISTNVNANVPNLLRIMIEKKTNLCVAADLLTMGEIQSLVDKIGPKICCLKIHYDIVKDWTESSGSILKELALKHNFLLMEDRKFFDIGNTVKHQLTLGLGRISSWANFVTTVTMPGPAILDALRQVQKEENVQLGALLVAEMSSKGNFFTPEYSQKCVELLKSNSDVSAGLIAQSRLENASPGLIIMTPGVKHMSKSPESLGQQYVTPEVAVVERGADVIIVGRGVIEAQCPESAAELYRTAGWEAYTRRVST